MILLTTKVEFLKCLHEFQTFSIWYVPFCFGNNVNSSWHGLHRIVPNLMIHLRFRFDI